MPHLVSLLFLAGFDSSAADDACPTPASLPVMPEPVAIEQPRGLSPYSIAATVAQYYDAPLGVGILEVVDGKDQHYYDWMFELSLPLWKAPDAGQTLGWVAQGKIYADENQEALTGAGMVETEYEHTSFIVWDTKADWLKLRLSNDLFGWTHRCHLETGSIDLEFVPWEAFFRRHADWLHFRKPVPHLLRQSPGVESEQVTIIGLNHKLELLEIRGDWMEVRVQEPDLTCVGPDPELNQSIDHRGWVKWRDTQGPWVYIYTRGC